MLTVTRVLVLVMSALAAVGLQTPPPAPKPAVLVGQVVDGSSKKPVGGAQVRLSSGARRETVLCDEQGRFAFSDLASGSLSVSASKAGYIGGRFGQRFPTDVEQPLELVAGEQFTDLQLPLWKLATISGVVEDSHGDPLVNLSVRAFKREFAGGAFRLTTDMTTVTLGTTTDDRGAYRLSVAPGEYAIGVPSSDRQLRSPSVMAFATTYFPSTLSPSAATVMTLASGEDRSGVNVRIATEPARAISGTVVGADSQAALVTVTLARASAGEVLVDIDAAAARSASDRTFTFANVAPGSYLIRVVGRPAATGGPVFTFKSASAGFSAVSGGNQPWLPGQPVPSGDSSVWWADLPVTVDDKDLTGLRPVLQPGVRMSGRMVFDGPSDKPTAEELAASLLLLVPTDGRERTARAGRIDVDGRFETAAVPPGRYELQALMRFRGWLLTSFNAAGRELREPAIEVGANGIDDVVMRYTDARLPELSGTVTSADGKPRQDASIYVFPVDRTRWSAPAASDLKELRPGRTGAYRTTVLPGREYFIAAVAGRVPEYWQRPEFLESLSAFAIKVTPASGEKRVVNLTVRDR